MRVVTLADYQLDQENELVARRFNEVEAADIQREAHLFVRDRNWSAVERLMRKLEERARENPWLEETVRYLRTLLERRDYEAMKKNSCTPPISSKTVLRN